jgi:hypothetical protein
MLIAIKSKWIAATSRHVDVTVHADGRGKRSGALRLICGFDAVLEVLDSLADLFRKNGSALVRAGFIEGWPDSSSGGR